jgi:hypothetical protein
MSTLLDDSGLPLLDDSNVSLDDDSLAASEYVGSGGIAFEGAAALSKTKAYSASGGIAFAGVAHAQQGRQVATFDGSGTAKFTRTALPVTTAYPYWASAWVRWGPRIDFASAYCILCSERASGSDGATGLIYHNRAGASVSSSSAFDTAYTDQAVIPNPYWEQVRFEFRSATDRRVVINNAYAAGGDGSSKTLDLSTGSPVTQIGLRAPGSQPFVGEIADVIFGSGVLSDDDKALLATPRADYSAITGITNWYALNGDGADSIGGADMMEVGASYVSGAPQIRSEATKDAAIDYMLKQSTVRAEMPTVSSGHTSPVSGVTNVSDVEWIDSSFIGAGGAWNTRQLHYKIASGARDHLVIIDTGHALVSDYPLEGMDYLLQQLTANGYAACINSSPHHSLEDPDYISDAGGVHDSSLHDYYWSLISNTFNPAERFVGPISIALNYLAPLYSKISYVGFSGGGWICPHIMAIEPRINHTGVAIRGTVASRARRGFGDFEQHPYVTGWKTEDFYYLAAKPNRRFVSVHHPTDRAVGAQFDTDGAGAYLDVTDYDTRYYAPVRVRLPSADVRMEIDPGEGDNHHVNAEVVDGIVLPLLATPLTYVATGGVVLSGAAEASLTRGPDTQVVSTPRAAPRRRRRTALPRLIEPQRYLPEITGTGRIYAESARVSGYGRVSGESANQRRTRRTLAVMLMD